MASYEVLFDTATVMSIIFAFISTIGSILVMMTILTSTTLRGHHKNCLLVGILLADLLMGLFAFPLTAESLLAQGRSQHGCELAVVLSEYTCTVVPFITLWGLVILQLDRLIRQACSLKSESSALIGIVLAVLLWLGMCLVVIPIASTINLIRDNNIGCGYWYEQGFQIAQSTVSCFLPAIILLVITPLTIFSRNKLPRSDQLTSLLIEKGSSTQHASSAAVVAASVVSVLLLVPAQIIHVLYLVIDMSFFDVQLLPVMMFVMTFMTWLTPCVFPFLWIADPDIRRELKVKVCCQNVSAKNKTNTAEYSKSSKTGATDEVKLG